MELIDQALQLCRRAFPANHINALQLHPLSAGHSHYHYRLTHHQQHFFIKLYNHQNGSLTPGGLTLVQQLVPVLSQRGLTPALLYIGDQGEVSHYIDALRAITINDTFIALLGQQLARLHTSTLDLPAIPRLDLPHYWQHYLTQLSISNNQTANQLAVHLARFTSKAEQLRQLTTSAVLCHQDLHPGNILYQGKSLYFIDWEYTAYNNLHWDLASLINHFSLTSAQRQRLIHHYRLQASLDVCETQYELAEQCLRFTNLLWWNLQPDSTTKVEAIRSLNTELQLSL